MSRLQPLAMLSIVCLTTTLSSKLLGPWEFVLNLIVFQLDPHDEDARARWGYWNDGWRQSSLGPSPCCKIPRRKVRSMQGIIYLQESMKYLIQNIEFRCSNVLRLPSETSMRTSTMNFSGIQFLIIGVGKWSTSCRNDLTQLQTILGKKKFLLGDEPTLVSFISNIQ